MTASDKLLAIYPVIRIYGTGVKAAKSGDTIILTHICNAFPGKFIHHLAAVCDEQKIGFAVSAIDNKPAIYL